MESASEGAIIIYLDSAFIIEKPIFGLISKMQDNGILLIYDRDRKNGSFIKSDSFALMDCTSQ